MTSTPFSLQGGDFFQDWSNADLITANDDWSGAPSLTGYLGNGTGATSVLDTRAALGDVDVNANQTKPDTFTTGGVSELQIDNPVVAFQGSGTAKVPSLVLWLDATGRHDVTVSFDLRDVDAGANTTQSFNVQYRVGDSGDWANVEGAYLADASVEGTSSTHKEFTLPASADGQGLIQVRFLTADASGSDELLGVDNIRVTSAAGGADDAVAPTLIGATPADNASGVASDAKLILNFSEAVYASEGGTVTLTDGASDTRIISLADKSQVAISGSTVTINPAADLRDGATYHVAVAAGAVHDVAGNDFAGTGDNPVDFTTADPLSVTAIGAIQGAGHVSTYINATVLTQGVVTAIDTTGARGFYLQDPTGDTNTLTSDGIFVFTGSVPTVQVGQSVQVSGVVQEYDGGNAANLTITEITAPTITTLADSLGTVHATIIGESGLTPPTSVIDNDHFSTFDPQQDGIDFYEALEGMVATVHQATAVGSTSQGATYVVADGGEAATNVNDRGGITVAPDDFNPERIQVYADSGVNAAFKPGYVMGDKLGDVTGVVSYFGGEYELLATDVGNTGSSSGGLAPRDVTTLKGDATHFTFAEYNVENLDPGDTKFEALGHDIANNLGAPDVIALEEIQDYNGAKLDPDQTDFSGTATLTKLIAAIKAAGGPDYSFVEVAPTANNTTGGEGNGNIHNAFLYRTDRVGYVDGSALLVADTTPETGNAFNNSRQPLSAQFIFNGETVTTVAVHNYARSGSDPLFGANQPPANNGDERRNDQTGVLHDYIVKLQAQDPDAKIAVAGDFNSFYFEQALANLETGGSLTNLTKLLDPADRYSTVFEGNSEQIDHILVSGSLLDSAQFDIVHLNTGQASPITDHDPTLASLYIPVAPLSGLAVTSIVVASQTSADETLTGTAAAESFYFATSLGGHDRIAGFGANDAFVVDHKLYDSDNNGIVTFGSNKVLDLDPSGRGGDTVKIEGISPSKGLRYLGEQGGHHVYESAVVHYAGSQESTVGDDAFGGTRKADAFFFNTALGLDLGDDTVIQFSTGDRIVTTTQLAQDADGHVDLNNGTLSLGQQGGVSAGTVELLDASGQQVGGLHLMSEQQMNGLTYYSYVYDATHADRY